MSLDSIKQTMRVQAEIAHRAVREIERLARQHHSAEIDQVAVSELADLAQSATSYRDLLCARRRVTVAADNDQVRG